jgi:hypothetical protein
MTPAFLCLIVLAMPFVVAALAAWAEWRPVSANPDRLKIIVGEADDDDSTLFQ